VALQNVNLIEETGFVCTPVCLKKVWRNKMSGYIKMPRPRKTPGQFAKKNGPRQRLFSVVFHDVQVLTEKLVLNNKVSELKSDWFLIAEEPYNHQDGQHLHLFLKYAQPKAFSEVLSWCLALKFPGRCQVDTGRSAFNECKKYLVSPDKDKKCDENVIINVTKLTLMERYPEDIRECDTCRTKFYSPAIWWPSVSDSCQGLVRSSSCHKCSSLALQKLWKISDLPQGPPLE